MSKFILKDSPLKSKTNLIKESVLINNPTAVLRGKTIENFKSNGYGKGYTVAFTDGTTIHIRGGGAGAQDTVYITRD